jgi:ABC-type transport system involved in cytochrome c biogenesis permease component
MYGNIIVTVLTLAIGAIGLGVLYTLGISLIVRQRCREQAADCDRRMRF